MAKQADLHAYLFDGQPHLLSETLAEWMEASASFAAFAETYRDKIRKKIRLAGEAESARDLRSELEVAFRLLGDRRLAVTYEPYASAKRRGPDFAVAYRANLVFNVEVARLRGEEGGEVAGRLGDLARSEERILRVLLDKLGQMQPGMANLLVLHAPGELAGAIDLDRLMRAVKRMADRKDPDFYAASRFDSPAAFTREFLRLSGILLWAWTPASVPPALWVNPQARPGLDDKVLRIVTRTLEAHPPTRG